MTKEEQRAAEIKAQMTERGLTEAEAVAFVDGPNYQPLLNPDGTPVPVGGGKGQNAVEEWRNKALTDWTAKYGPGVATQLMSAMSPWLTARAGDTREKFQRQEASLNAQVDQQLGPAMAADQADRHKAFQDYFSKTFTLPEMLGLTATKAGQQAAARAAIAGLEGQYETEYEDYYTNHNWGDGKYGSKWPNTDIQIANFLYAKAQGTLKEAMPHWTSDSMTYQDVNAQIRQNVHLVGQVAQQKAAQSDAFARAKQAAFTSIREMGADLGVTQDDADTRRKLSEAASALDDPYLSGHFVSLGGSVTADQYVSSIVGQGVSQALASSPKYMNSVVTDSARNFVDLVGTQRAIKMVAVNEKAAQTLAVDKTTWEAQVDAAPDATKVDPAAVLKKAGVDANGAPNYKEAIRLLGIAQKGERIDVTAQNKAAVEQEQAKNKAQGIKDRLAGLPPEVLQRLGLTPGDVKNMALPAGPGAGQSGQTTPSIMPGPSVPGATGAGQSGQTTPSTAPGPGIAGSPAAAASKPLPTTEEINAAIAQHNQAVAYETGITANAAKVGPSGTVDQHGIDQSKLPVRVQAVMQLGLPLNALDAQDIANAHTLSGRYADVAGTSADLWTKANGDVGAYGKSLSDAYNQKVYAEGEAGGLRDNPQLYDQYYQQKLKDAEANTGTRPGTSKMWTGMIQKDEVAPVKSVLAV